MFQLSGFQRTAFEIGESRLAGGGGHFNSRIGWTAKDWKAQFERLSPEVKTAIKSVARPNTTKQNREKELRDELIGIDVKFLGLYVQLMERMHTEQLEERQRLRDEQARLLAKTLRQVNDDDLSILLLLL
jgi:hypothetical protein